MEKFRLQSLYGAVTAVPGRGSPSEEGPEESRANSDPPLLTVRAQRLMGESPRQAARAKGGFLIGSWGLRLALKTKKD